MVRVKCEEKTVNINFHFYYFMFQNRNKMWFRYSIGVVVAISFHVWMLIIPLVNSAACNPPNCSNHGVCNPENQTCTCSEPYSGSGCEQRDPCKVQGQNGLWIDRDCGSRGKCVANADMTSSCKCETGYLGSSCEIVNNCVLDLNNNTWPPGQPCLNGGKCQHHVTTTEDTGRPLFEAWCVCKSSYIGLACEYVDPCYRKEGNEAPCHSRGECTTVNKHMGVPYKRCKCQLGYDPVIYCERRDPCLLDDGISSVCMNKASCEIIRNKTQSTPKCNCPTNYDGPYCERVNKCGFPASLCHAGSSKHDCNPCLNGGECISTVVPVSDGKSYRAHSCNCANTTYFGDHCELLRTRVILIPAEHTKPAGITHVESYNATSGRKHVYYIVAIAIGPEGEINVDTGDGFEFHLSSTAMKPIPVDIPALSELKTVRDHIHGSTSATYYPLSYTYEFGNYEITLRILDGGSQSDKITTRVQVVLPDPTKCVPFSILKNVGHTIKDATQYKRPDTFVVEVDLRFDCFESEWINDTENTSKFRFEWKLHHLSHMYPSPTTDNDWHADLLTNTQVKYLRFDPHVLLEGLYWVECRAYAKINGTEYGNSDKGFFRINSHPPKIILLGGHTQTVDKNVEIVLDASQSTDDSYPEHSPYLQYTWTCLQPCELGPWDGSVLHIPPGTFEAGSTVSLLLRVESAHAKSQASTNIQLHIVQGSSLSVRCVRNCEFLNPYDEVIFEYQYLVNGNPGSANDLKWIWLPKDDVNVTINVVNDSYEISVIIPTVHDITTRSLVCIATHGGAEITSQVDLKINTPPSGGNCTIVPESGLYLKTEFSISCTPFMDSHLPLEYTFFAEIERVGTPNRLIEKLDNRLHLGHDTDAHLEEVYLPFGDQSVHVIVVVTDDLGLSHETKIPVTMSPVSMNNSETISSFLKQIAGNDSLMTRRFLRGDYQGALQLQMLAAYGLEDPKIAKVMENTDITENTLKLIQQQILSTPQFSFLANEQLIYSTHMMDHVENSPDPIVLLNVTQAMYEAASKLVQYAKDANEVTSSAELVTLADAVADSGSRLLRAAAFLAKTQNEQLEMLPMCNERNLLDFDPIDEHNPETFFDVIEDDLSTAEKEEIDYSNVNMNGNVGEYAKSARNSLRAMRGALDGAIGHLGVASEYTAATDKISSLTKIMSQANKTVNVALKPKESSDSDPVVRFKIPGDTLEVLHDRIDTETAKLELQAITTKDNAYFDDTSACPSTVTLHLKVQDSHSHVPVLVEKLESPVEISLPVVRRITEAELEAGKSVVQQLEIPAVEELNDYYQPPTFLVHLPYNSKIIAFIDDQSSDSMAFKMLAMKGRKPVLSDFCREDAVTEVDPVTKTAVFFTDRIELNEEPDEPFLDYHVSVLVFDFHNIHRLEQFSVVFSRYSCIYRDENQKSWSEKGCMTSNDTIMAATNDTQSPMHLSQMTCICNHASVLSGVQFVIPCTVDHSTMISGLSIDEIAKNPVVLVTVCVLLASYLITMIFCRLFDIRDSKQDVGLTIMADLTVKSDQSKFYLITVVTGCNFWAGTTASVGLVIYGSNGRSKVFTLKDRSNTVFLRGDVDTFLVSCDKDLGELEKIRMWTDHTGVDPAWYCRKILIRSVRPNASWYFYVNRWLTVTAEETNTILEVPATTAEERKKFSVRLKENLLEQIDNVNLWISIFRYSPASPFTRCQRLSCAFAVLTGYLLMDIWFYGTPTEDEEGLFDFGEYTFDLYGIIKSIQIVILALPFGLILITVFRSIRSKYIPTLIIWENVIPAKANANNKNLFIPSKEEQKSRSRGKNVQLPREGANHTVFQFEPSEEESMFADDRDTETSARHDKFDHISTASTASAFSIPSTDVPKLENWIQDRVNEDKNSEQSGAESDDALNDVNTVGHLLESSQNQKDKLDPFVRNVDSSHTIKDNLENDTMTRLGRRAMLSSVRDHNPDTFIFEGENDISRLEEMIDQQLLENRARRDRKSKKKDTDGDLDTSHNEDQGNKEIVLKQDRGNDDTSNNLFKKVGKAPWKKSVTTKYLEDIDQALENELESKQFIQDKANWESQIALEMCQVSVDFSRRAYTSLPWWFIFIAWGICLGTIVTCCFFTVLHGIYYGYLRSLKWLETLVGSCLISIFVVQPTNALVFAAIGTFFGKRQKVKERLQARMEDANSFPAYLSSKLPYKFKVFSPVRPCEPLRGNQIFRLSIQARRRKELHGKLIRLILCVILLIPLIAVSYSGHNHYNYEVTHNIRNIFKLNDVRGEQVKFRSEASVYDYLEKVVVNNLHPTRLYNNEPVVINGPTLLSDQQTLLVGVARIRQQRVKAVHCLSSTDASQGFSLPSKKTCNLEFKKSTQDRDTYDPVWEPISESRQPSSLTNDGWEFHRPNSAKTESITFRGYQGTYDGGGYILELGRTRRQSLSVIKYMKKTQWLDHRSRGIFVEITLMNPNIDKFVDVVLLIEQGPTGSFSLSSWVSPIELIPIEDLRNSDEVAWVTVSMVAIIVILFLWMIIVVNELMNSQNIHRFRQTGFWMDIFIVILVFTSLCVSVVRFISANDFADAIEEKKVDDYLSIQNAAYWTDVQRSMFSVTQAVVFIKFWKLLMFTDKRFLTFALTLKLTGNYMLAFAFVLAILLCAFASFGHYLFGQYFFEFSTWGESIISLVDHYLGASFFYQFVEISPILGPAFVFMYGYFFMFIGLNLVVALLDLGVHEAKEVVQQRRVWLTYFRYFKETLLKSLPCLNAAKKQALGNQLLLKGSTSITVHPDRWLGMKLATSAFIKKFLVDAKVEKMKEMQRHCNKLLAETGYRMIGRKQKAAEEELEKQKHIEQLRVMTSVYIKEKLGHDMKPKEFNEYANINKYLVKLRIRKMEEALEKLERKFDQVLLYS